MNLVRYVLLAAALVISACGGGGGGAEVVATGDTFISVTPTVLTFTSESGEPLPAAQNVSVTYEGAGLLVGYPPGEPEPDWIQIVDHGGTAGSHTLGVYVSSEPPVTPGQRSATLRIVTALADGEKVKYADIAITQNVLASTFTGSATPSSLGFLATSGGALPSAQQVEIQLSDGQVTGAVSNVPWLSVATAGTTVTATISTTSDAPSTREGIIYVSVTRASGSVWHVEVPVSFTLGPAMVLNPTVLAFEAVAGDSAAPMPDTRSFTIDGSNLDWTASSDQDWLVLGETSGNAPGTIGFTVDHSGLPGGEHAALISVYDAFSDRTRTIGVTLRVQAAQLVLSPAQATFVIDSASTAADLTQAVSVGDDAIGDDPIAWSVTSVSEPWLEAAPASGSSRPAAELTLSLDTSQFAAVGNGVHHATVTLGYSDPGGTPQTRVLNVQLDLSIPHVDALMPYLGIVDVAGNVVLHGEGLGSLTAEQVTVGGVTPTSLDVLSDKAVRLGLPGFAAGTYAVELPDNMLGEDFSTATLEVIAAQDRPYAVFPLDHHSVPGRLLFDDERETLYVADLTLPGVSRYQHATGAWIELPAFAIPQIRDIALSHDGSTLYILANKQIYTLDLDDPVATPQSVHTDTAYPDSPWLYLKMAIAGDTALLSSQHCCAFTWEPGSSVTQLVQPPISASSLVLGSGDGSRVYLPASTMHRYSAATGQFTALQSGYNLSAVNQDGSRLMNFQWVLGDDLSTIGLVRKQAMYGVFARRSDRIYAFRAEYTDLDSGLNVYVVDPTGTPDADNVLPEIRRIAIPGPDVPYTGMDSINSPTAASADGKTFFIQGQDKLLIVPTGD